VSALYLLAAVHAASKLPGNKKQLVKYVKRGLPHAWPFYAVFCGLLGGLACVIKAVRLSRWSDPLAATETVLTAFTWALYWLLVWSVLFTLVVPYLAALPNFVTIEARAKLLFRGFGVFYFLLFLGIFLAQLLHLRDEARITLSTLFFVSIMFVAAQVMATIGIGGYKVRF
jgi:uncharacterized protein YacL